MMHNSFDDHIKKNFGNYEPEVPAHIWKNIVAGKEKRKPAGWLFNLGGNQVALILAILVLSAGGAVWVHSLTNATNDKPGLAIKDASAPNSKYPEIAGNSKPIIPGQQHNEENTGTKPVNAISDQNINPTKGNLIATETGKNKLNTATDHVNNYVSVDSRQSLAVTEKPQDQKESTAKSHPGKKAGVTGFATAAGKQKKNTGAGSRISTSDGDLADSNTDAGSGNNGGAAFSKQYLELNSVQPGKPFDFSVKNLNLPALNIPCPAGEKNTAANKRYFEVYGGPDYVFRTFNDTANSAYLQKRKESTTFTSAFSVGFRYTKVFNNAMSFRTGLNYSQVNEKFKFEQGHIIQLVYNINANGDTTGSYATTGTRYKTTHNHYKTIDIPLLLGYEMGNGRFHTNINAGLVVNVCSWQKGDILDGSYQPVNITTGKSSSPYQFKSNIGVGFLGGASFYYKLNDRLHILAEPYFRYNFSASNKSDITLKQKYTTTGLRLGLRVDF